MKGTCGILGPKRTGGLFFQRVFMTILGRIGAPSFTKAFRSSRSTECVGRRFRVARPAGAKR